MTGLRLLAVSLGCAAILSPKYVARADFPLLTGTVFNDVDRDGLLTVGDVGLPGVTVQLYADDGNEVFDASLDEMVASAMTDLDGAYEFFGLGMGKKYFVRQQAQVADGIDVPEGVSELLTPLKFMTMVDDFSEMQGTAADPITRTDSNNMPSASVLGGQRDLHIEYMLGPADSTFRANPYGLNKVLEFDQSAGGIAIATITWDGMDADESTVPALGGLGGIDMTADGSEAFAFNLGVDAAGDGELLNIRVYTGSEVSTVSVPLPITNGTASMLQVIPFDSFVGGASFQSVDAIQLEIGGKQTSIDAQVGPIGSIDPAEHNIPIVPEPSAILLGLFATLWIVGSRRGRKRNRS